ncbi:Glyoxylase, beta-lactamase superfamily II [Nocardia amikacinitolerans]|uniref:MBL fold metallo-hydrolase n=1 Tax=Nocardia amikacinitolerans TaxID=756689 RepID=UPI00082DB1A2|nr:MBL fold metallo-hydrolase [Nocardia amikacinitolerans]MCP2315970.1 Glyoxylase, beta-lactamase superfamily II [Nocardia amikacinitolerans]
MSGELRIDQVVTSGVFELDDGVWEVDNNVWVVGDDDEVLIIDAAHDSKPIIEAVAGRNVVAVVCTHGHNDHVTFAPELGRTLYTPVVLHPGDRELWEMTHPEESYWHAADGMRIALAGTVLDVIHTPGHSPGSICLYLPEAKALFSGDTLFSGGPGATGRSFSDFPTIIGSIRDRLFALPEDTRVYTGHGEGTTIATEAPHLSEWIERGF